MLAVITTPDNSGVQIQWWAIVVAVLGTAGFAALVTGWFQRRKTASDAAKSATDAAKTVVELLHQEVKALVAKVDHLEAKVVGLEGRLRDEVGVTARLRRRIEQLERFLRDLGHEPPPEIVLPALAPRQSDNPEEF